MSTSVPMIHQTAGPGAARAAARKRGLASGVNRRPGWVTYTLLGLIITISAYPIYYAFLLASSDAITIAQTPVPSLIPGPNLLENLERVITSDIKFWPAVLNSLIVALATSISVVFFATLAGFAFAKLRFRGRRPLLVFIIATMAVPTQLGVVPLFIVMSRLGWTGSLWAVIAPAMVTAFGVFWMTQYLRDALPDELIEAVRMDGASMIRSFWHIGLPAARPAAAMLALFTFIGTWTNFFWPFIVLGPGNPTLPVALQQLQAAFYVDYSLVLAGVVLSIIPLILVFIFLGKQLVAGIMQGAVKG